MKNKGLTAYRGNEIMDRREVFNPEIHYSELLTIANAEHDDSKKLVVEFQKTSGKSLIYVFFNESAEKQFIADVVGYDISNPCPQSFMKLRNIIGKEVEGIFNKKNKSLGLVAPIFPYCDSQKNQDNSKLRALVDDLILEDKLDCD